MKKINKLNKELINLIAAGEVVERPSSAAKELIENAIDAKATEISVRIEEAGSKLIEIQDNGSGIEVEDAQIILDQHTTSKIRGKEDLEKILSLGFRGEALASISEVSGRTEIISKSNNHNGIKIVKENGEIKISEFKKADLGTTIRIENLFEKVPARKKFLKKASTEMKHITETFLNLAIPFYKVKFKLIEEGRDVYNLNSKNNLKDRIYDVFGKKTYENINEVKYSNSDINLTGFIGNSFIGKKRNNQQYIFLNNRLIKSSLINSSIKNAYTGFIHRDLQPTYFLNLEINPAKVDVNVHPRKLEVKFEDERKIFVTILNGVKKTLEEENKIEVQRDLGSELNSLNITNPYQRETKPINDNVQKQNTYSSQQSVPRSSYQKNQNFELSKKTKAKQSLNFTKSLYEKPKESFQSTFADFVAEEKSQYKTFEAKPFQVFNTYIVFEKDNQLTFIDQHAAAEKINFEKLLKNVGSVTTKPLLIPEIVEMSNLSEKSEILEKVSEFKEIGFIIDDFGGKSIQVSEIPENLEIKNFDEVFVEFLEDENQSGIMVNESEMKQHKISRSQYLKMATIACHGSIRAGQGMSEIEMRNLINDILKLDNPGHCPHGRPILWKMKKSKIEEEFNRDM